MMGFRIFTVREEIYKHGKREANLKPMDKIAIRVIRVNVTISPTEI